jgi:hypothetical protein
MDETERLLAMGRLVAESLSTTPFLPAQIPVIPHGSGRGMYVELRPLIEGVEYEIRIRAAGMTAEEAKVQFDELKQNSDWVAKALEPGTDEATQFANLQRFMARGHSAT